jgi:predicted amidohydrolase
MGRGNINLCLIQADIHPLTVEDNIKHYENLLEQVQSKPDIIVFPEMFACGFSEHIVQIAADFSTHSLDFLYKIAQKYNADTVASFPVQEEGRLYNRLLWVRGNNIVAHYDKRHLFFGYEKQFCTRGDRKIIVTKNAWNFLPLICYDIRFPLWCRNQYNNDSLLYDCLVLIANFPAARADILQPLLTARAIENQAYVIVVNRVGEDGLGNKHHGNTMIINPLGEVIAHAPMDKEQVLVGEIDRMLLDKLRMQFPVYEDWDK